MATQVLSNQDQKVAFTPELDWNKDSPTSSLSDASYFDKHTRTLSQDTSLTSIDNDYNPLQIITESLVSGKQPKVNPVPVPTDMDKIEATKKPALETNSNRSSLFGRWSLKGNRASLITPLPGFQEELLAQMEQMNTTNLNDPKTKILKRKSIRKTLVTHQKDDHDWDFWSGTLCDYATFNKNNKDLIQQVRHGIPSSIRGMVWQLLAKSNNDTSLVDRYVELLRQPGPYDKMIQRDLSRTFPGHTFFQDKDGQGQEALYNVIKAYSIYDPEVGYCQGLAFVVGPLLLKMPDEDAFCVLVKLMYEYDLRGHFTPEMDGLLLRLYIFDRLVEEQLPHVARHFQNLGISSNIYASQWFMTLFAYKFPMNLVNRIYDVLLTEGSEAIYCFAIALLRYNQKIILGLEFDQLLDFLKNGLFEKYKENDRGFVDDACQWDIPPKLLVKLEKEYRTRLQKETAQANQMDALHKSHVELQQRLEQLTANKRSLENEHKQMKHQLSATLSKLNSVQDEQTLIQAQVQTMKSALDQLPAKVESNSQTQFEELCQTNAELIGHNLSLEDKLQKAENTLIEFKMNYAQSENEKEMLQRKLFELKKLMRF